MAPHPHHGEEMSYGGPLSTSPFVNASPGSRAAAPRTHGGETAVRFIPICSPQKRQVASLSNDSMSLTVTGLQFSPVQGQVLKPGCTRGLSLGNQAY